MSRRRIIYQVDVFTRDILAGNAAGVVLDAEGLSDGQMQGLARELNNSETAFVFPPRGPDHDIFLRFFTPTTEVPSCGHATLGANYARARELDLDTCRVRQRSAAGIIEVEVDRMDDAHVVAMRQRDITLGDPWPASRCEPVLAAFDMRRDDLLYPDNVRVVSTGHSKLMLGIASSHVLHALTPDMAALARLGREHGFAGFFLFTFDVADGEHLTDCRMFAPQIGIPEDPVTGNGNAPLGVYLANHRLVEHDGTTLDFVSRQGFAMGRPGFARIRVEIDREAATAVRVEADVTPVFRTEIIL